MVTYIYYVLADAVMFVRHAKEIAPVVVAVNAMSDGFATNMTYGACTQCEVGVL